VRQFGPSGENPQIDTARPSGPAWFLGPHEPGLQETVSEGVDKGEHDPQPSPCFPRMSEQAYGIFPPSPVELVSTQLTAGGWWYMKLSANLRRGTSSRIA
jgi:hypothetical protein